MAILPPHLLHTPLDESPVRSALMFAEYVKRALASLPELFSLTVLLRLIGSAILSLYLARKVVLVARDFADPFNDSVVQTQPHTCVTLVSLGCENEIRGSLIRLVVHVPALAALVEPDVKAGVDTSQLRDDRPNIRADLHKATVCTHEYLIDMCGFNFHQGA